MLGYALGVEIDKEAIKITVIVFLGSQNPNQGPQKNEKQNTWTHIKSGIRWIGLSNGETKYLETQCVYDIWFTNKESWLLHRPK